MEGNGQNDRESRLKRLEDAYELMIQDHEEFRREHKMLLTAQVVMQGNLDKMQDNLEKTRGLVHEIGDKLNALITWSDQVHRDNNERFKRLEEKH
jgi:hypothetical protein